MHPSIYKRSQTILNQYARGAMTYRLARTLLEKMGYVLTSPLDNCFCFSKRVGEYFELFYFNEPVRIYLED